jgi:DNA-damage-inducible protein D
MKYKLGVPKSRPLADFLPAVTIAAKNLATEITNFKVREDDLYGELKITIQHVQSNRNVREILGKSGIQPENLPAEEDIKKLERRIKTEDKKSLKRVGKLKKGKS